MGACRVCVGMRLRPCQTDLGDEIVEVHATSAGLKGLCTYLAAVGIEDLRKSCGGHGYLLNSGIAHVRACLWCLEPACSPPPAPAAWL